MVAPVGDEYSQLQHENIPPSRHDIQVDDSGVKLYYSDIYICIHVSCECLYLVISSALSM